MLKKKKNKICPLKGGYCLLQECPLYREFERDCAIALLERHLFWIKAELQNIAELLCKVHKNA